MYRISIAPLFSVANGLNKEALFVCEGAVFVSFSFVVSCFRFFAIFEMKGEKIWILLKLENLSQKKEKKKS